METIGGLVMTRLGRIPEAGDEIAVGGSTAPATPTATCTNNCTSSW
ncbi:MAG: Magnesium and cobalt efflux protein CorC [uncultured Chloroflexi bacterium]|uniref:Magnesium and cobalt efflux protein CorC n=1 Tax=uncultured Chloroflexota bacterium TaxID=166587 RepID=A0A6J4JS04_9CHLR|nr:MAG: Magnesium and cobalt efflux protein CorC [uncultured Chloroflexota bacterium]